MVDTRTDVRYKLNKIVERIKSKKKGILLLRILDGMAHDVHMSHILMGLQNFLHHTLIWSFGCVYLDNMSKVAEYVVEDRTVEDIFDSRLYKNLSIL